MPVRFGKELLASDCCKIKGLASYLSLLSMGALFGLLAAYYYWSPLMLGYSYNEYLAKVQFYVMFIGANLLFFPMHFLGLAGCPRRISDYPDAYKEWNYIASIGSMVSFFSLLLFLYIIYRQFSDRIPYSPLPSTSTYLQPYLFFKSTLSSSPLISYSRDIEFLLPSPPSYHHYHELPVA